MQTLFYSTALLAAISTLILSIYSLRAPDWIRFDTPKSSPFQYSSIYGLRQKCDRSNLHPEFQCRFFPDRERDCTPNKDLVRGELNRWPMLDKSLNQSLPQGRFHQNKMVPIGSGLAQLEEDVEQDVIEEEKDLLLAENFPCDAWLSAAYTGEFSIIIGIISMFCIFIVILGNDYRKRHGWKICGGLIAVHGLLQTITWALIINVFNTSDRFYFGSKLSTSAYIAIASSVIDVIAFTGLFVAGFTLNENDSSEEYEPISE